ncbi:MAG: DUF3999 family protein [Phycisphaerae bacterium]
MTRIDLMRVVFVLASCVGAGMSAAADGPDLTAWRHVAAVQLESRPAKGVVELSLPAEVFAGSRADLADLRLAAGTGGIVPYVLRVDRGTAGQSVSYEPKRMFNPVYLPGKQGSVTLDFGGSAKRTEIDVDTPGTNFRRRVMVEASGDGEAWQVLRETAWLFRIAYEKGSYSKNRVTLPDNDFRYLRVTVFNASDDPERVEVRAVRARYAKSVPPLTVEVPVLSTVVTQRPKIKATEIEADLGHENLPLHAAALSFEDANFLRRVEVLGRNRLTRTVLESVEGAPPRKREAAVPWRVLTGGTIHRFSSPAGKTESSDLRPSVGGKCRYLLIRIYNGDNAPLKLTGVKVTRFQHHLAFQPKAEGTYKLYFGNEEAGKPQYDLAHFVGRLRDEGVTAVSLGPASPNPLFAVKAKAVPWSERYKAPLWGVLIAVLLVLGVLVVRQARRARPAGGE